MQFFLWAVVLFWIGGLWLRYWQQAYQVEPLWERLYNVQTADGWRLGLARFGNPEASRQRFPVLLCHGLGADHFTWVLPRERNLATFLVEQGFDVWAVDLRGSGWSRPELQARAQARQIWSYWDFVQKDLPAVLERIQAETGRESVHWIGHSMGGIVGLSRLGSHPVKSGLASLVTIGSSIDYSESASHFRPLLKFVGLTRFWKRLPLNSLSQMGLPFVGRVNSWAERFNWYPPNLDGQVARQLVRNSMHPLSGNVLAELAEAFRPEGLRLPGGKSVASGLGQSRVSALLLAGDQDMQCPPDAVEATWKHFSKDLAQMVVCAVQQGFSTSYGHFDLVAGKAAPQEVWPKILEFLQAQDQSPARPTASDSLEEH